MQDHTITAAGWHCHPFATAGQVLNNYGKIYIVIKNRKISLEIKALERKPVMLGVEKFRERMPTLIQCACGDGGIDVKGGKVRV